MQKSISQSYVMKGKLRSLRGAEGGVIFHTQLAFVHRSGGTFNLVATNERSNSFRRVEQLLYENRYLGNS
jgi:hypothetical protein